MPKYATKALERLQHPTPPKPQNAPHQYTPPQYGAKAQYTKVPNTSPLLDKKGKKYIQAVTGTFLYYGRAVNPTILVAINALATEQSKPTEATMERVRQFLDYCAMQEDAVITYHASDMILEIHSNAGYFNESGARSRVGGHFFLSTAANTPPQQWSHP